VLWSAVADFAGAPGGADGLGVALAGATTARLASGYVGSPPGAATGPPFESMTLWDLGNIYRGVASTVGQSRFNDLLAHVEDDGSRRSDAALAAVYGAVGEVPGGSTATGVTDALAILSAPDTPVFAPGSAGSPLAGVQARLTRDLVAFNLAAHPEWATDDVREALRTARTREGLGGIALLLYDQENQFGERHSPELEALRQAVNDQVAATGIGQATSQVTLTSAGGG
jgi:hypothetical protein